MNPRLTTILTLSGVLVAGTAAAAVNSSILSDRSPMAQQSPAAGSTVTVPVTVDDRIAETVTYQIGDAGDVLVQTDSDHLEIEQVNPASGWTLVSTADEGARVQVVLTDTQIDVTFTASLVRGVVVTSVESAATSTTTSSSLADETSDDVSDDVSEPAVYSDHESDDDGHDESDDHSYTPRSTVRHRTSTTVEHDSDDSHESHDGEHEDDD